MSVAKVTLNGDTTLMDTTGVTVNEENLMSGFTALDNTGTLIEGDSDRKDLTEPKDVDFVDFDGRLLYSYTATEFANLSELPANPSYPGLTAQGWNWSLADAKAFVSEYGALVVGHNYITDDGKTRIYITLPESFVQAGIAFPLFINKASTTPAPSFVIDWGDGTTTPTPSSHQTSHQYQQAGDYVITIDVSSGSIRLGYLGSNNTLTGTESHAIICVNKVEVGSGVVGFGRNCFSTAINLKSVSISTACIDNDTGSHIGMFDGASLTGVVFPAGTPGQNTVVFGNKPSGLPKLKYVAIPKSMTGFEWSSNYPRSLRKLIFYNYNTSTDLKLYLYDCQSLTHFIVPGTYTNIPSDRCRISYVRKLLIPASVTSIGTYAFCYNHYCEEVHLLPTTPPTLSNTNTFYQTGDFVTGGCIFYVPYSADHSILNAYQTATNWSTYASQMQEEPQ